MGFVAGVKNILTVPAKRNERRSRLGIVPTADQMQTDMVWNPLAEQIEHGWDESLPKPLPNPDDLYRPTLIGAWAKDRLIGGAFVMPDSQDAQALVSLGADKAARAGGGRGQRTVQSPSGALPGMGRRAGGTRPGCGVRASDGTGVMDRKASRSSGRRSARIHRSSMSIVHVDRPDQMPRGRMVVNAARCWPFIGLSFICQFLALFCMSRSNTSNSGRLEANRVMNP